MCGIIGGININSSILEEASSNLSHRGPDDSGSYIHNNVVLINKRLSIQDIKRGRQPYIKDNLVIIFNGEIYNHRELRIEHNLKCHTDSDTETLINLYHKFGSSCLDYLDGMFAFAIYDKNTSNLFLARDRCGEKPLYYYHYGNNFCFSSELNALRSIINPEINRDSIMQYLRYCIIDDNTPYEFVKEIPPGYWMNIDCKTIDIKKNSWWNIEEYYSLKTNSDINKASSEIEKLLSESIKNRIETSEPEVGIFLSGGIDSSLITALASEYRSGIKTFTVSFDGMEDETEQAALVARRFNTKHSEVHISFDNLAVDLPEIISNYGEPFSDSSSIPSYYVSKAASRNLKVVLNGDGADELFAGYRRYVPFRHHDFLMHNRSGRKLYRYLSSILPVPTNKRSNYNYIYRLFDLAGKEPLETYLSSTINTFEGFEHELSGGNEYLSALAHSITRYNKSHYTGLQKIMLLDFHFQLANDLLTKMDIATMSNSIEGRSPFLSKKILETAPSLDCGLKVKGKTTKFLLRHIAKKYLPPEITNAPKRGFEVPIIHWTENRLKDLTYSYLDKSTFSSSFVSHHFISDILQNKVKVSPDRRAKMIWNLLCLEIWYKECYLKPGNID